MGDQGGIESIDAHEDGRPGLIERLDETVHVARVGNQPIVRADREVGDEIHHQGEDVIERNRGDDHVLAGGSAATAHCLELLGIRDQVSVRQTGTLGQSGRPARVLQEQKIVAVQIDTIEREGSAFDKDIGHRGGAMQARIHRRARKPGRAAIARPDRDDRLERCRSHDLRYRCRGAGKHDHDLDARVLELVLEFARRIERIDVNLHGASPDDAEKGYRECQQIGHHDGDTIAFLHPEFLLQIGSKIARLPIDVGIGQCLPKRMERRPTGMRLHGLFEHFHDRAVSVRVDFCRNAVFKIRF